MTNVMWLFPDISDAELVAFFKSTIFPVSVMPEGQPHVSEEEQSPGQAEDNEQADNGYEEPQLPKEAPQLPTKDSQLRKKQPRLPKAKPMPLVVTLDELERTIDPLIAARAYNYRNSPLGILPDELLLHILDRIGDDVVTLYCLRRVSRTFRRLIYEPRIWKCMRSMISFECTWLLEREPRRCIQQRLRRDGMCYECRSKGASVPAENRRHAMIHRFLFDGWPGRIHCSSCGTHHDAQLFSSCDEKLYGPGRGCLGCQGAVRLCEHVYLPWSDIENHMERWRKRRPGEWGDSDWDACLGDFVVECRDPSHDTRCTPDENPTRPRAILQLDIPKSDQVKLTLEWSPTVVWTFSAVLQRDRRPPRSSEGCFIVIEGAWAGSYFLRTLPRPRHCCARCQRWHATTPTSAIVSTMRRATARPGARRTDRGMRASSETLDVQLIMP
ncbi:F-box-like domain-containing protein [Candidatus Bathyarchaeota archaeon]|nr:F-box-like domain-containing protein [Candidatus Bathyarchaeota archaeon]